VQQKPTIEGQLIRSPRRRLPGAAVEISGRWADKLSTRGARNRGYQRKALCGY
jgi:hypothetical protein